MLPLSKSTLLNIDSFMCAWRSSHHIWFHMFLGCLLHMRDAREMYTSTHRTEYYMSWAEPLCHSLSLSLCLWELADFASINSPVCHPLLRPNDVVNCRGWTTLRTSHAVTPLVWSLARGPSVICAQCLIAGFVNGGGGGGVPVVFVVVNALQKTALFRFFHLSFRARVALNNEKRDPTWRWWWWSCVRLPEHR